MGKSKIELTAEIKKALQDVNVISPTQEDKDEQVIEMLQSINVSSDVLKSLLKTHFYENDRFENDVQVTKEIANIIKKAGWISESAAKTLIADSMTQESLKEALKSKLVIGG